MEGIGAIMTMEQFVLKMVRLHPGYCTAALKRRYVDGLSAEQVGAALYRLEACGLVWKSSNPLGGWYHYSRAKLVKGWLADPMFRTEALQWNWH